MAGPDEIAAWNKRMESMYGGAASTLPPELADARTKLTAELIRELSGPERQYKFQPYQPSYQDMAMMEQLRRRQNQAAILATVNDKPVSNAAKYVQPEMGPLQFLDDRERRHQLNQYQQAQLADRGKRATRLTQAIGMIDKQDPRNQDLPSIAVSEKVQWQDRKNILDITDRFMNVIGTGDVAVTQQMSKWLKEKANIDVEGSSKWLEQLGDWFTERGIEAVPPEFRTQMQFWADLEAELIAPWRNETFGATLTTNEQAAFERMSKLKPTMNATDVRNRLHNIQAAVIDKSRDIAETNLAEFGPVMWPVFQGLFGKYWSRSNTYRTYEEGYMSPEEQALQPVMEETPEGNKFLRQGDMVFEVIQ